MKSILKITGISLLSSIALFSCKNNNTENAELTTLRDSASYALGLSIGANFAENNLDSLNSSAFLNGLNESSDPESFRIPVSEINLVIQKYMTSEFERKYQDVIKAGEDFLASKEAEEGVMKTESGLLYKVIKQGTGATPEIYDSVTIHYHGTRTDGSVFESSKGGDPITFVLGTLIPGWVEGLMLVPTGSTVELYIPYDLAYGSQGKSTIKPFETLIFEIELIDVKKGAAPQFDPAMLQQMQQMQQQ